jgi:hypothetical protein
MEDGCKGRVARGGVKGEGCKGRGEERCEEVDRRMAREKSVELRSDVGMEYERVVRIYTLTSSAIGISEVTTLKIY